MTETVRRILESSRVDTARSVARESPPTLASRCLVVWLGVELVLCTLAYGGVHYWALGLLSVGAAVTVILWAADAWSRNGLQYRASWLQLPLVGIAFLALLQLLPWHRQTIPGDAAPSWLPFSFDPFATRLAIVSVVVLLIFFAAASAFIDSRTRLRGIVAFIVILGAVVALLGLIQYFVSPLKIYGFREPFQALPFGPFIDRNHFAAFAVMILPLPGALLLERAVTPDRIPLYAAAILLLVVATVMTGSRGGLLTLVAVAAFLVIVQAATRRSQEHTSSGRRRWILIAATFGLGTMLIFSLVLILGGSGALRRIAGQAPTEDAAGGGRAQYWRATVKMIRDHPVIGVGLDAYGVAFPRYDSLNGTFRVERAHNDYLQTLAETGVIGSLIALAFVVILFRQGVGAAQVTHDPWRRAVTIGSLAGCFGVLVHSIFEFPLRTPANALLFLLLAVLATGSAEVKTPGTALDSPVKPRTELE
jgi:O-antigen ligase